MGISLTSKIASSAGWVFSGKVITRLFEIIKLLVLARLLLPEDFGLFGLVMLTTLIFEAFSETGLRSSLIQHKGNSWEYLNTVWTIQILRGGILSLIFFSVAPFVAWFFNEPRIVLPLRAMSLFFLVQGFINIETIYFEKDLNFHKLFWYEITANALSLVTGILLGYLLRSVWALVWANLTAIFVKLILSYVILKYRPRFQLNRTHSRELFKFGRWICGYTITLFLCQQIDKIFLGKIIGAGALGLYQVAQRISELPASHIAVSSITFTFPAYAKISENRERLGKAFLDVVETITSLVLPLTIFIFCSAPDIVSGVLGEKWYNAVAPLRILSLAGFLMALDAMTTPIFMAVGKPNLEFWKTFLRLLVIAVSIYPLTLAWGLRGTCVAIVLGSLSTLIFWIRVQSIIDIRWSMILLRMVFPLVIGFTTFLSIVLSQALFSEPGILSLAIMMLCSIFSYGAVVFYFHKAYRRGILVHAQRLLNLT
jgi:O-antigen/teichoic acid export membrane protein